MGRDHSIPFHTSIQHILMFNTFHHPIIPSPHHPLSTLPLYYYFLHMSTDLIFGVVTGDNPALSPVFIIDAGSISKDMIQSYQDHHGPRLACSLLSNLMLML